MVRPLQYQETVTITFQPGSEGLPFIVVNVQQGNRAAMFDPKLLGVSVTADAVASVIRRVVMDFCGRPAQP